jgi:hypothetical protein
MPRLTPGEFVQKSLDLNLFFLRIMKEHSFFLEAAFLPKNGALIARADNFRDEFEELLEEAVELGDGNVSRSVLKSGEIVTDKTIEAEKRTRFLSGVPFDIDLTRSETQLQSGPGDPDLAKEVAEFNDQVIRKTMALVDFKTKILEAMLECRLFTWNFPLLIEHIRREARFFIAHLERLQKGIVLDPIEELIQEKVFWDRIMAEHSLFIAHLLDPTETDLINTADNFARTFFKLEARAKQAKHGNSRLPKQLLKDEIKATGNLRDFKDTADELILECEIRSIIVPLLADHVLREANHFYAILTSFCSKNKGPR